MAFRIKNREYYDDIVRNLAMSYNVDSDDLARATHEKMVDSVEEWLREGSESVSDSNLQKGGKNGLPLR